MSKLHSNSNSNTNTNTNTYTYTDANVYYNIKTKKLHLYDGTITEPIVSYKHENGYRISKTENGLTYITVEPTYFHNK